MARRARARTVSGTRTTAIAPVVVTAPAAMSRRRGGGRRLATRARRASRSVRRYAGAARGAVASEKHTLTALAAAGAYGLLRKSGVNIPTVGPLGPAATVGLAAWAYGRWGKSQTAQHVATGLLSIAIYSWATTGELAGEGDDGYAAEFADEG